MKFSENWLRTFVNPDYSGEELAHALTMAGLEVESYEPVAASFEKVVVAEVLKVEKLYRYFSCAIYKGIKHPF